MATLPLGEQRVILCVSSSSHVQSGLPMAGGGSPAVAAPAASPSHKTELCKGFHDFLKLLFCYVAFCYQNNNVPQASCRAHTSLKCHRLHTLLKEQSSNQRYNPTHLDPTLLGRKCTLRPRPLSVQVSASQGCTQAFSQVDGSQDLWLDSELLRQVCAVIRGNPE